jgi:putative acetyltransferase
MVIRSETRDDHAAIRRIVRAAAGPQEARLVDLVRQSDRYLPNLSFVAADQDGTVLGYLMLSRVDLVSDATRQVLCLAPMAVAPARQRAGVGSTLIRHGLGAAEAEGEPLVLVLGHATYYPRFGFEPARAWGIEPPNDWTIPDEVWMVRRLDAYTAAHRGRVRYPTAFEEIAPAADRRNSPRQGSGSSISPLDGP